MFLSSGFFNWVVMPLLIFIARICDESFETIRVVFISQGLKKFAAIAAFFEVFVWILVARQVITNLNNFLWIIAYCIGYATGTYVGIYISEKMSIGRVVIRVILKKKSEEIIEDLRNNKFGVTVIDAHGLKSKSKVIFSIVDLKDMQEVISIIKKHNEKAFYSVEPVRDVREGTIKKHVSFYNLRVLFARVYHHKKSK